MNGSASTTYAVVEHEALAVAAGGEELSSYRAVDRGVKHFCARCGTTLCNTNPGRYPGLAMLYRGAIASHEALRPAANVYRESALAWVAGIGRLPDFAQGPPRRGR